MGDEACSNLVNSTAEDARKGTLPGSGFFEGRNGAGVVPP